MFFGLISVGLFVLALGASCATQPRANPTPASSTVDTASWQQYTNERYGFSVRVPVDWEIGSESANADGVTFNDGNPQADVRVFGRTIDSSSPGRLDEPDPPGAEREQIRLDTGGSATVIRTTEAEQVVYEGIHVIEGAEITLRAAMSRAYEALNGPTVVRVIQTISASPGALRSADVTGSQLSECQQPDGGSACLADALLTLDDAQAILNDITTFDGAPSTFSEAPEDTSFCPIDVDGVVDEVAASYVDAANGHFIHHSVGRFQTGEASEFFEELRSSACREDMEPADTSVSADDVLRFRSTTPSTSTRDVLYIRVGNIVGAAALELVIHDEIDEEFVADVPGLVAEAFSSRLLALS